MRNPKIKPQNTQSEHAAGRTTQEGAWQLFVPKNEKMAWQLDFLVLIYMLSHNGLVRQKRGNNKPAAAAQNQKFVQNAGSSRRVWGDLCAHIRNSAHIL